MRSASLTALIAAFAAVAPLGAPSATAQALGGATAPYFRLELADALGRGKCLEANALGQHAVLGGATFLDRCQAVTGQMWTARTVAPGRFHLSARFGGPERCLTVNAGEVATIPTRTPYMAPCGDSTPPFETIAGPSGAYFRLRTAIAGEAMCLGARPASDVVDPFVPVVATPCEGRADQTWRADAARLVEGVPVALTAEERRVIALEAPFGKARPAACEWNDGTSDRAIAFACLFEEAPDGSRFVVTGPSLSHAFEVEPDRPNAAEGFLRVGNDTVRLGRFERRADDPSCWANNRSGERLCVR